MPVQIEWSLFVPLITVLFCFVIGAVGMYYANRKVSQETAKRRWIKLIVYFFIVHTVYFTLALGQTPTIVLCLLLLILGLVELILAFQPNLRKPGYAVYLIGSLSIYLFISSGVILCILTYNPPILLYIYLVIAFFDGFSQLSGLLIGKTPLAKTLSPNKTVEGFVGGVILTVALAYFFRHFYTDFIWQYLGMTLCLCLFGLAGDLLASSIKRLNSIKDFSQLLPQHGGILDRFDGFFFSLALFYYLNLIW